MTHQGEGTRGGDQHDEPTAFLPRVDRSTPPPAAARPQPAGPSPQPARAPAPAAARRPLAHPGAPPRQPPPAWPGRPTPATGNGQQPAAHQRRSRRRPSGTRHRRHRPAPLRRRPSASTVPASPVPPRVRCHPSRRDGPGPPRRTGRRARPASEATGTRRPLPGRRLRAGADPGFPTGAYPGTGRWTTAGRVRSRTARRTRRRRRCSRWCPPGRPARRWTPPP